MREKHIIIGTTSINRPFLHSDNIPDWYRWINSVDKDIYNIQWFINIDYIEKLSYSIKETQENYKNIIKDIPLHFLESNSGNNFLNACKRVSFNIEKYVKNNNLDMEDVIIIWLEDDWKLKNVLIPLSEIIDNYLCNLSFINLSFIRNNYIHSLAPSIINYKLWSQIHLEAWKTQIENIDPEHCVGLYFLKNFSIYEDIDNLTIVNKDITDNFLEVKFMNYKKSFYTFNSKINHNLINDRYIEKKNVKKQFTDKIVFMRITYSMCSDIGRKYMNNLDIYKNNNSDNFYN